MDNPLLALTFDVPFDRIAAEHVEPAFDVLIPETRAAIDAIAAARGTTWETTLGALERATEPLERASSVVGHLEAVATTPAFRAAYTAVRPKVAELWASVPLNAELYRTLRAYAATDDARALDPTRARYLTKTLDEMRRHGAELGPEDKARLEALDIELSRATTRFSQNVLDATNAFDIVLAPDDEPRLGGLPGAAREAARERAEQKGLPGWRFTLHEPSLVAVLTYADDRALREAMWRAYNGRAANVEGDRDNRPLVRRILALRREKARLLGYRDFADLVLADRMAHEGARAAKFVDELRDATREAFDRETRELDAFRREAFGADAGPMEPWDVGYWSEKLRRARFDFDEEELRAYFPADRAVDGLFRTAERLYGFRFTPRAGAPTWHADVQVFDVHGEDGRHVGSFYVDLHPRESKRGGAWMNGLVVAVPPAPHLALFCANVSPPSGGKPALLLHREVETLFHEFGHLLHHLHSRVTVRSLGGTNVPWDFVELPSQIMENWCWERDALDLFARHHGTDAPVPDALFEKMTSARTFRAASMQMRQLGLANVDLALHRDFDPSGDADPIALAREVLAAHAATPLPADYAMIASFTHLFASPVGYGAGYYSYKWAEVLDADAFGRFSRAGVFDRETGRAFAREILSRGDAADPMELFRAFMGRDASVDALLVRNGLRATAARPDSRRAGPTDRT